MTFNFNNVYLNEVATITGSYEACGPLKSYFDYSYDDFYFGTSTWEQAESKSIEHAINLVLAKSGVVETDIDGLISGDLSNQMTATNFSAKNFPFCLIGLYAACATSTLSLALASILIDQDNSKRIICSTSSHNNAAEKQFRYPVEYGGPKPKTTTFTSTGAAAAILSSKKSNIKVESATVGRVIDSGVSDVFNMGAVMAVAAADTIYRHLKDTGRKADYYDLILTGDLGIYGKIILREYMQKEYSINLANHDDSGVLLYDVDRQPVYAGASGPVCLPLVTYTYIFKQMKERKLKRVLLVATGALHSQSMVNQKLSIPSIAHAVSLEAVR